MKASELADELNRLVAAYGDLPVAFPSFIGTVQIDREIETAPDSSSRFFVAAGRGKYPENIPHFTIRR